MTGSPLVDLFLAMAMFYFALCMVCSSANDAVARVFRWRAATLRDGIRSLLLNATVPRALPDGTKSQVELLDLFFNHPFVQTLRLQAELGDTWWSRLVDGLGTRLENAWRGLTGAAVPSPSGSTLDPQTKLTFVPSAVFVHTLTEILTAEGSGEKEPLTFAALWRALNRLPDDTAGPLKVVLKSLVNDPNQNLDAVQEKVAKWFDDGMAQATLWYRQRMRTLSLFVGAVMVLGLNIDSIDVANRFYRDANLRAVYVAAGQRVAQESKAGGAEPVSGASVDPVGDLRLGWQTTNLRVIWEQLQHGMKWAGLIITIVAIGMGASFWHDVITRLVARKTSEGTKG
jgi:hypothetical protein